MLQLLKVLFPVWAMASHTASIRIKRCHSRWLPLVPGQISIFTPDLLVTSSPASDKVPGMEEGQNKREE